MKTRKLQYELSLKDLNMFPVWEFAFGEQDDLIKYKPSEDLPPLDIHKKSYLIKATYDFANGKKGIGFIKPIDTVDTFMGYLKSVDLAATILTNSGQVKLWYGGKKPNKRTLDKVYRWLGISSSEVFPLFVKGDVEITNGIDTNIFDGFYYCNKDEVEDFFHMKLSEIRKAI